jgi:hypothetical protein
LSVPLKDFFLALDNHVSEILTEGERGQPSGSRGEVKIVSAVLETIK